MAWIGEVETSQVSNVIKVMSINPKAMNAVVHQGRAVGSGASALTRAQEEAIATVVSVANRCRY